MRATRQTRRQLAPWIRSPVLSSFPECQLLADSIQNGLGGINILKDCRPRLHYPRSLQDWADLLNSRLTAAFGGRRHCAWSALHGSSDTRDGLGQQRCPHGLTGVLSKRRIVATGRVGGGALGN